MLSEDHLSQLPKELLIEVISYLSLHEISILSRTALFFNNFYKSNDLWKYLLNRDFNNQTTINLCKKENNLKKIYQFQYFFEKQEIERKHLQMISNAEYQFLGEKDSYSIKAFLSDVCYYDNELSCIKMRDKLLEKINQDKMTEIISHLLYGEKSESPYKLFLTKRISRLPRSILNDLKQSNCEITSIHLSANQLQTLPEALFTIPSLEALFLTNNAIRCLPRTIAKATSLNTLLLENNQLTALPIELFKLSLLTELRLGNYISSDHGNKISEISEDLGNLTKLVKLDLSNITLRKLPSTITYLKNLKELELQNNPLPMAESLDILKNFNSAIDIKFTPSNFQESP